MLFCGILLEKELNKIEKLRHKIDATDLQLVKLLNNRAGFADEIGKIKRKLKLPVYVPSREIDVIAHVQAKNPGPLSDHAISRLYERIIDESRRLEKENLDKRDLKGT